MNPDPPPSALRLFVINVQGLSSSKFPAILRWLREKAAHGAILTETHVTSDPFDLLKVTAGGGTIWPGMQTFFVPGTGSTEGVTIILGPGLHLSSPTKFVHPLISSGRILRVDLRLHDTPVSIIGVYGPTTPAQRASFYADVLPSFLPPTTRPLIVAGDFNVVLSDLDCWYPPGHPGLAGSNTRLIGAPALGDTMSAHSLTDIWRHLHPTANHYTHFSRTAVSGARLDRILLNDAFRTTFSRLDCSILPAGGFHTDHCPVRLTCEAPSPTLPRGTGILSFPLEVLNFSEAVEELRAFIQSESAAVARAPTPAAWSNFKARVRDHSHVVLRKHRRLRQQAATAAEIEAAKAKERLEANTDPAQTDALVAAARTAADASVLAWQELLGPAELAAKILDHQFGDQSSFYFFRAVKQPDSPTTIAVLNRPGRSPDQAADPADLRTPAGRDLALKYATDFYSSASPFGLFRPRPVDVAAQSAVLGSIRVRLPAHLSHLAEGVDGEGLLTREELKLALAMAGRGTCPGADGLPYEFYRHFQVELTPLLLHVFNTAFEADLAPGRTAALHPQGFDDVAPLRELLLGIICLLRKPGQPLDELLGYRPITLLNCDIKLVMLIISTRLQRPMDYIIDIAQSAFLRGRDITDNVRYHLGLRARLQELGMPAWLLHSDLTKAYDTADRGLLIQAMRSMGLRNTGVVHWNRILLNGTSAQVRVNGFFTPPFNVYGSSFPQGGALSTNQWVFIGEIILSQLSRLQHSRQLSSFQLPSGDPAPAAAAFADDITAVIVQPSELSAAVRPAFEQLATIGTPAQSFAKTALQHLNGPIPPDMNPTIHAQHQPSAYSLLNPTADRSFRHLGVPFAASLADRCSAAFSGQPSSMSAAGAPWQPLAPNILGRVLVSSQCLASKAIYQANFHSPATPTLLHMQRIVNSFVATSSRCEEASPVSSRLYPSASVCLLPRQAGGLGIVDLAAHFAAMRAKPCWLSFRYAAHPWASLFRHEISLVTAVNAVQDPVNAAQDLRLGLPPGHHWLVTRPTAGRSRLDRIVTDSFRESAKAFLDLHVQRVIQPSAQDHLSIMLELTFFNPVPGYPGIDIADVSTSAAKSWLRLRDVCLACRARPTLPADQDQDLTTILSRLPPAWRVAIRRTLDPEHDWVAIHAPGTTPAVFEGPDPMADDDDDRAREDSADDSPSPTPPPLRRLWLLFPNSGRLEPFNDPTYARDPTVVPRPALIITRRKPKTAWNRADYDFEEMQRDLPPVDRKELVEPWLVGLWADLQLDPRVWGVSPHSRDPLSVQRPPGQAHVLPDGVSLLDMDVKTARTNLSHRRARDRNIAGYNVLGSVWPPLWPWVDTHGVSIPTAAYTSLRPLGLAGMEERWRRPSVAADEDAAEAIDRVPAWLDLSGQASLGPAPRDLRAAGRAAAADLSTRPAHPRRTAVSSVLSAARIATAEPTSIVPAAARVTTASATVRTAVSRQPSAVSRQPAASSRTPTATAVSAAGQAPTDQAGPSGLWPGPVIAATPAAHGIARQPSRPLASLAARAPTRGLPSRSTSSPRTQIAASAGTATAPTASAPAVAACSTPSATPPSATAGTHALPAATRVAPAEPASADPASAAAAPAVPSAAARIVTAGPTSVVPAAARVPPTASATVRTASATAAPVLLLPLPDKADLPWRRLLDRTLYRPFVITAWRILHGQLGCHAFMHHVQRNVTSIAAPCSNLCRHPACLASGSLETLSHAFLDCPASAPAIDWLCSTWAALTNQSPPPRTAAVLLADDLRSWTQHSPAAEPRLLLLWTRLRITVIGSIWAARCARDQGTLRHVSLARFAVMLAVRHITEAIQRDWLRTSTDIRTLDNGFFCTDWWRGMDPKLSFAAFSAQWAFGSVFCTVDEGDADADPPRPASLEVLLGRDKPVRFPD